MEISDIQSPIDSLYRSYEELCKRQVTIDNRVRESKVVCAAACSYSRNIRDAVKREHIGTWEVRKATSGPIVAEGYHFQNLKLQDLVTLTCKEAKIQISIVETKKKWKDANEALMEIRELSGNVAKIVRDYHGNPEDQEFVDNCMTEIRVRAEIVKRKKVQVYLQKKLVNKQRTLNRLICKVADAHTLVDLAMSYVSDLANTSNHHIVI